MPTGNPPHDRSLKPVDARQRRRRIVEYALAVALTVVMMFVRNSLAVSFGERPLLILFMFPVIVSALLGGLGPGLTATLTAAACTAYLIPPAHSFTIAASHDAVQWGMLIANGVLVSLLSASLHRSRGREITRWRELVAVQDQLQQSETRFQATFEQAAVGIALVAPDGRWLRVNRKLCEIVGYRPEELLALTFQSITHPDDLPTDLEYVRRMLAGEIRTYALEKRYLRKDGGAVWINLTVALLRQPDATPDYFIVVIEDIQARKQTEIALRESEATLKESQRLAGVGNWTWDVQSDRHTWSEEIYLIYNHDPALPPVIYPEVQKYFTPESWARLSEAVEVGLAQGVPYQCDAEVVRPDGGHRWITARGEAIRDAKGDIINLHGTVQDITERKQAEVALRESQARLSGLITSAMDAIISIDSQQQIVLFNAAAERMFLCPQQQALGQSVEQFIPDRFRAAHRQHIELFRQTGITARAMGKLGAISGLRTNGEEFPIEASISQMKTGQGVFYTVILRDITERRQAEMEIHRLNTGLEERVRQRTAELVAANQELDSFAYAVSHDLRAPLRAMSGFSQALVEDYGAQLEGEGRVYLDQIILSSHHMSQLIDGLLVLSRSTRGELRRERVNLTGIAERLRAELSAAEPERPVTWAVEPALRVQGDPIMLEVVMRNLIENAWKYTAKTPNAMIRVYSEEQEGERCCCVADNGAGFDMSHANRLFKAFQRLHRQDEFPGTGIGLATVQRIIHRHGGVIRAEGIPGRGATFRFTLPDR